MATTEEKHSSTGTVIVWLRNDLRLADNPALSAAMGRGWRVIALHIEETDGSLRPRGAASRWWRHHSLRSLSVDLAGAGVRLVTASGTAEHCIDAAVRQHRASAVYWNRRYAPAAREIDASIKTSLRKGGIEAESFPGDALAEPFDVANKAGEPYSVFTPFWRALRGREIAGPLKRPNGRDPLRPETVESGYRTPAWAKKLESHWKIGEPAARRRLERFLESQLAGYPEGRDYPACDATSRLSPHLAHGEISPRQVWHAAMALAHRKPTLAHAVDKFLSELAWRDFNIHQLHHRADIATVSMQPKFAHLKWRYSKTDLHAWQRGVTGIPLVDAGMRELWDTGFMHNRVRMVTASFLAKNLLIDWREGERWFWDTLVDADEANNPGNWQWVAGCGLDAAPFFRIFNPLTQAEKFDPDGDYVRRWGGKPREPIVDLKKSREHALAAFKAL